MELYDAGFMIITTGKVRILNYFIAFVFLSYLNATRNQPSTPSSRPSPRISMSLLRNLLIQDRFRQNNTFGCEWFFIPIYSGDLYLFSVYSISADYVCLLIVSFSLNANQKQW